MTALQAGPAAPVAPASAAPVVLPLTDTQVGLLVAHRAYRDRTVYNVVVELDLDPAYSGVQVRAALAGLLAVQPALRLGLHELPEPHAVLAPPPGPAAVPLTEVAAPTAAAFAADRAAWLTRTGATDFALDRPPLLRAVHLTCAEPATSALLLCVHHTVFDGFSLASLVRDLSALLSGGAAAPAAAQRERALENELRAQVAAAEAPGTDERARAWAARLAATEEAVLHPVPGRPAETDFRGARRPLPLGPTLSAAIDETCRGYGLTPFVFFSAALAATVARHASTSRVVLGTPVVARRTVRSYELCGLFVNTLPLVVDVDPATSFAAFAAGPVAGAAGEVRRDADVPWPRIVRHGRPDRAGNRNPFFSTMIAMQDSTVVAGSGPVRAVREHGNDTAKLDLWLGVTPTPAGWLLELEHDCRALPAPVVDGIERTLLEVLRGATADAGTRLRDLVGDVVRPAATPAAPPRPPGRLVDRLIAACHRHAGRVAVEDRGGRLTYAELGERAAAAAAGLRTRSVQPGDVVGLTTAALPDTVVAMLGILRAGAAYLPLDPTLPAERLAGMVEQAGCRTVVGNAAAPGTDTVALSALLATAGTSGDDLDGAGPDGVYVMFTSGSTGSPKGVHMGDGPLSNLTDWQVGALGLDAGSRFLQYAPLGFDVSFQEIVPTLVTGGTVVGHAPVDRRDLPAVAELVHRTAVTHAYLPVAALRAFVLGAGDRELPALRVLCVSGEQLTLDPDVRRFLADRPRLRMVNLYGPTETHAVTTHEVGDPAGVPAHVPIGLPIPGVTAQVVDSTGHLAPTGVVGDLLLGGRCPALGYLNDPEQTAARFLPDPYGPPDARRYRTGDRVVWDVGGRLVFLGRDDDQVKIRGHRVELGEVEAEALARLDAEQAVALVDGTGAEARLLLCVVPRPGATIDPAAARAELGRRLPAHMVPAAVIAVAAVPKTANGKVDRKVLLADAQRRSAAHRAADRTDGPAPADPLVAALAALWADVLGVDRVQPTASLVELGAHSLKVLLALARIEAEHGVRVPMLEFFREPTVDRVAALVRDAGADR